MTAVTSTSATKTPAAPAPVPQRPGSGRRRSRSYRALEPTGLGIVWRWIGLSIAAILSFFPFYAMIVLSLKPGKVVELPGSLLPWNLSVDSYAQVLGGQNLLGWRSAIRSSTPSSRSSRCSSSPRSPDTPSPRSASRARK